MAGGIFTTRPFEPNPKCIVFGFGMIGYYWLSVFSVGGKVNYWLFPLIFVISYVLMAYYDAVYDCQSRLYSGDRGLVAPFDSIFKPQLRTYPHRRSDLSPSQEEIYQKNVYLFHLFLVVPVLSYVGYRLWSSPTEKEWSMVLLVLSLGALLYHGFRLFRPRVVCNVSENELRIEKDLHLR